MGRISVEGYEPAHLSHSTVSTYRMCGTKAYLEKVRKVEGRPGVAALGGNAVHLATELLDLAEFYGREVDINDQMFEEVR